MNNGVFLLACCTATVTGPFEEFFKASARKRVFLPVASLDLPAIIDGCVLRPVFKIDNPLLKILVEDCGGHGRALEVLSLLTESINLDDCDVGKLMRDLSSRLIDIYGNGIFDTKAAKAIVRGVFTHRCLYNEPVPGTGKVPEQIVAPCLIRFVRERNSDHGYFSIPSTPLQHTQHQRTPHLHT